MRAFSDVGIDIGAKTGEEGQNHVSQVQSHAQEENLSLPQREHGKGRVALLALRLGWKPR
jgi:hypothetical protein